MSIKKSKGKGIIRLGDKTIHGGRVISAQATFNVLGKGGLWKVMLRYALNAKGLSQSWQQVASVTTMDKLSLTVAIRRPVVLSFYLRYSQLKFKDNWLIW